MAEAKSQLQKLFDPNNRANRGQNVAQILTEEHVDLIECQKELNFDARIMEKQIEKDQELLDKLSNEIRPASRRNFELERNLNVIDKQIQLLIQNIIDVSKLDDMTGGMLGNEKGLKNAIHQSPLEGKKQLYEQLFHILQKEPRYFGLLSPHVAAKDISDFVKTVVFDMYGDQYDSREERLLLTLFKVVLEKCFDEVKDIGSFLRANTAISQMLSAYARRGQGLGILRDILEKPIREMVAQTTLNLEINPVEVYRQIINSYEQKMNKPWDGPRNPTNEEAAENKYVQRLIPPRVKQLEYIAEHFLSRIIETVEHVPFGIRWICRQLAEMAQKKFPDSDRYQIGGLVGGYIYLRFFNPVIVTPESVHFVDKKLSKTMRRNLILVAKILQNLSNGVDFRDEYMQNLQPWIEKHREDIQTYFARLIDVDDLEDRMDVDNLLEHTRRRDYTIQVSFNQIFLVHRLLLKHRKEWLENKFDDPVLKILAALGPAPENVKHQDNYAINIRLAPYDEKDDEKNNNNNNNNNNENDEEISVSKKPAKIANNNNNKANNKGDEKNDDYNVNGVLSGFNALSGSKDPFVHSIRIRIRNLLCNDAIPLNYIEQYRNSLCAYLYNCRDWAKSNGNIKVLSDTEAVIQGINKYITTKKNALLNDSQQFNNFLSLYVNEIRDMKKRADRFHSKLEAITKARDTITDHANYLETKLTYYKQYLENVRQGGNANIDSKFSHHNNNNHNHHNHHNNKNQNNKNNKNQNNKNVKPKQIKFTHQKLQELNIILEVDENVLSQTKANIKNLVYLFCQIGPDEFEVEVKYKVGFGATISPFPEPFQISLSKLLEMREQNILRYQLEMVTLNVNLLINLLNTSFVAKT